MICCLLFQNIVDSYGLDNDDFNTEELEEAVADIQDTLGADNYEDQLPQPEVSVSPLEFSGKIFLLHSRTILHLFSHFYNRLWIAICIS